MSQDRWISGFLVAALLHWTSTAVYAAEPAKADPKPEAPKAAPAPAVSEPPLPNLEPPASAPVPASDTASPGSHQVVVEDPPIADEPPKPKPKGKPENK